MKSKRCQQIFVLNIPNNTFETCFEGPRIVLSTFGKEIFLKIAKLFSSSPPPPPPKKKKQTSLKIPFYAVTAKLRAIQCDYVLCL